MEVRLLGETLEDEQRERLVGRVATCGSKQGKTLCLKVNIDTSQSVPISNFSFNREVLNQFTNEASFLSYLEICLLKVEDGWMVVEDSDRYSSDRKFILSA